MADKEKYLIKIQGKLIEVSEDIYYAYISRVVILCLIVETCECNI